MTDRTTFVQVVEGDQLSEGFFNELFNRVKTYQIYTSTGFDTTITGTGNNEDNHELTAIATADIAGLTYLKISVTYNYVLWRDDIDEEIVELKIQTKEVGGAYADSLAYTELHNIESVSGTNNPVYFVGTNTFVYYHTLTAGEKTNGVQVNIFSKSTVSAGTTSKASLTNVQTTISAGG